MYIIATRLVHTVMYLQTTVRSVKVAGKSLATISLSTDKDGKFCSMLEPGHYTFTVKILDTHVYMCIHVHCACFISSLWHTQPVVSAEEEEWGLLFVSSSQDLTVAHSPTSSLSFSQFTTTLTGTLFCLGQTLCTCVNVFVHTHVVLMIYNVHCTCSIWMYIRCSAVLSLPF